MPSSMRTLGALGVLFLAACDATTSAAPAPARPPPPGIVLLVVDTLRADAVPLDDASPTRLPSLRRFAKEATTFSDAIAPGAWTPQSMPTLLTGLTPPHTGCEGMPERPVPPLPEAVLTLAERLKAVGYSTTAHTGGGYMSPGQGLAQGFDLFTPSFDTLGPEACISTWARGLAPGTPFFLLLHTYGPHDPYGTKDARAIASAAPSPLPPSPTLRRVHEHPEDPDSVEAALRDPVTMRTCVYEWFFDGLARPANSRLLHGGDPTKAFSRRMRRWLDGGYLQDPEGREPIERRFREAYEAGLSPTDEVLGRTFAALEAAKLPPDTIVIVTSDHGEAHGEHGFLTHARSLHDEVVHVPLWIRAPGRLPAGAVVRGTCGLVDVAPTLVGLARAPAFQGELDGRSLLPLVRGEAGGHPILSSADRQLVSERGDRNVRETTVRDDRLVWSYTYDLETGDLVDEHVIDRVADPRALAPRPVDSIEWPDAALYRLVTVTRDESRSRLGRAALAPLRRAPDGP